MTVRRPEIRRTCTPEFPKLSIWSGTRVYGRKCGLPVRPGHATILLSGSERSAITDGTRLISVDRCFPTYRRFTSPSIELEATSASSTANLSCGGWGCLVTTQTLSLMDQVTSLQVLSPRGL